MEKEILSVNGEVDQEKLAMRKRIIELEMENEILKKAVLIIGSFEDAVFKNAFKRFQFVHILMFIFEFRHKL